MLTSRRRVFISVLAVLALAALACSALAQPTPTPVPTPTPPPPPPPPTNTPAPQMVDVTIVNQSNTTVCYVYISPSTDTTWGTDRLGSAVIEVGQSFTVPGIAPGTYDLRADDCSNNSLVEEYGIVLNPGPFTWTITGTAAGGGTAPGGGTGGFNFTIINNSSQTVCYAYLSASNAPDWGPDQLGGNTIAPGGNFVIGNVPAGTYDLRLESCTGDELEEYGILITDDYTFTVTD